MLDGLMPDDRVVVRGLQRVKPGAAVAPTLVDMGSLDGASPAPAEKQPQ